MDVDEMMTRQVNHGDPLSLSINRTNVDVVAEVDDKSEAFQGRILEKIMVPLLGPNQHRLE